MKLSICMMVKNEEKNLERCLNSLKSLRETLDSELIIVDTGSTDSTVEIAKRYTDRVYFHAWNNNFSEMRNITISYAKGEWLFIIDADEELLISEPIIKELQKKDFPYKAIAIELVNVVSTKGALGSKLITLRFFKNDGKFCYEGSVHNRPVVNGNAIKVDGLLYHYGYVADDADLMENKFNRTSELLLAELEKNPQDIYYLYQLATSYDMYNDNEKAVEFYSKAYDLIKDDDELKKIHFYIYGSYVKTLVFAKDYEKAIEIADEGLKIQKDYIDLIYFSGLSYLIVKKYNEGIERMEEYLVLLSNLQSLEVYNNPNVQLFTANAKEEAISNLCTIYLEIGKYSLAYQKLETLVDKVSYESIYFTRLFEVCLKTSIALKQFDLFSHLWMKIDDYAISEFEDKIYAELISIEQIDDYVSCIKELAGIKSTMIDVLLRSIKKEPIEVNDNTIALYKRGVKEVFIAFVYDEKMFGTMLSQLSESAVMEVMGYLESRYDYFTSLVNALLERIVQTEMTQYNEINAARIISKYLFLVNISEEQVLNFFERYILYGFMQIECKYSLEFLNQMVLWNVLNAEEQLLICLFNLKKAPNRSVLELSLEIMPEWNKVILEWVKTICDDSEKEDELRELSKMIKSNIDAFIKEGQLEVALNLVNDYLSIQPNDMDMLLLKTQLMLDDINYHQ